MGTSNGPASSKATAEVEAIKATLATPARTEPVRVAVVTSDVPFVEGGHRVIARSLAAALQQHGFQVEIIRTAQNRFGRQFAAYLANWLTDVSESGDGVPIDQVISCVIRATRSVTLATCAGSTIACASTMICGPVSRHSFLGKVR